MVTTWRNCGDSFPALDKKRTQFDSNGRMASISIDYECGQTHTFQAPKERRFGKDPL